MNFRSFTIFALVLVLSQCAAAERILSIGNSLIEFNQQPLLFQSLASAAGKDATWHHCYLSGRSLLDHWALGFGLTDEGEPSARTLIAQGGWTHIILQDFSSRPLLDRAGFHASVRQFKAEIAEHCPDAKILLFENWPYSDVPDYAGDLAYIRDSYLKIADEVGALIVPVGEAFNEVRMRDSFARLNPYVSYDNRHPSLQGSVLSAAAVFFTVYGRPFRLRQWTVSDISVKETRLLQRRARTAVRFSQDKRWTPTN